MIEFGYGAMSDAVTLLGSKTSVDDVTAEEFEEEIVPSTRRFLRGQLFVAGPLAISLPVLVYVSLTRRTRLADYLFLVLPTAALVAWLSWTRFFLAVAIYWSLSVVLATLIKGKPWRRDTAAAE
jgi:hypothetical protein